MNTQQAFLTVKAIQCAKCFDIIYSRALHDMRFCTCGTVAIDGGRDYTKIMSPGENSQSAFWFVDLRIPQTTQELYDDWNNANDQYGIIRLVQHTPKGT